MLQRNLAQYLVIVRFVRISLLSFAAVFASPLVPAQTQTYRLIETVKIGQKLGYRFNATLQPCAIAIDASTRRAYCASRSSTQFPIFDTDSARQIGALNAPFAPTGARVNVLVNSRQQLLYIYPTETLRDSIKTIYAVNPQQNQVVTTATYSTSIGDIALHERQNRLYVADGALLRVLDGTTLEQRDSILFPYAIGSVALDSLHDRLYAVAREPASGQGRFGMYTLTPPYSLVKNFTFPSTMPVLRAFIDTNWNRFLLALPSQVRILQLGSNAPVRTVALNGTYTHFAYSCATERYFAMSENGYAANGEHGNFGKLLSLGFIDDTRDSIRLGLKPVAMALDEVNKRLAVVSEQEASVTWYNMDSLRASVYTNLAMHFDDMTLSPDGLTMFMANHLGKSQQLFLYTFVGQELSELPTGTWTTALASDSARGRIYALSHQENAVYILSTFTGSMVGKAPIFGFKEQRGDALSTMCYDRNQQKMYIGLPEYKTIAVLDLGSGAVEKTLKIWGYSGSEQESGVGKIQMAYAPEVNKLYVLRTTQKRLNIYNLNTSVLIDSLNLASHWSSVMALWAENLLAYDAIAKRIYVGAVGIDCGTNKIVQILPSAARFVGYNSKETILYSLTQSGSTIIAQEHDTKTLAVTASRTLYNSAEPISPVVYLDSKRNHLYLLDRLEGVLHRYDTKNLIGAAVAKNDGEDYVTLTVFPNPVTSQATVRFGVKHREKVRIVVYDSNGREVSVLTENEFEPGNHTITLRVEGSAYTTQNYTIQLKSPSVSYTKAFQIQR
ncbi:MAG: T9SS type A sorting domain-containing protein [Candidatus Kapabacteria bacterium]|jgi:hypothetical protein|nr:T9SS type A sorting domain-containing protein [Candidatus Kapabacteria bacterium]